MSIIFMEKGQFRKTIISNLIQLLKNNQPPSTFNLTEIEESFSSRKTDLCQNISENGLKLVSKVYGINYQCIADAQEFHYSNNIKTLTLAIMEIAFQDFYTASLLVTELKQNIDYFKNIENFPLQTLCPTVQYPTLITEVFLQLCEICQQRIDLPLRQILSMSHFGLEMISMILRSILIKMQYPNSQNYTTQQTSRSTHEIFTIICEYLDITIIANTSENSQVYLFTDYNIFIVSADNQEFVCGRYFENEEALRESEEVDEEEVERLVKMRENQGKEDCKNENKEGMYKEESYELDLRDSGSQFVFEQNSLYHNDPYTPQFGELQSQQFKFRKSVEKQPSEAKTKVSMIKQQQQVLEGSLPINKQEFQYKIQALQVNEIQIKTEKDILNKPIFEKNKAKTDEGAIRLANNEENRGNREIGSFLKIKGQIKQLKSKSDMICSKFNNPCLQTPKQKQAVLHNQLKDKDKNPKQFKSPLDNILDRIRQKNQEIKTKLVTKQTNKKKQQPEIIHDPYIQQLPSSNKQAYSQKNQLSMKMQNSLTKNTYEFYSKPFPITPEQNREKFQEKFRKYSENRLVKKKEKTESLQCDFESNKKIVFDPSDAQKSYKKSFDNGLSNSKEFVKCIELKGSGVSSTKNFVKGEYKIKSPQRKNTREIDHNMDKKSQRQVNKIPQFLRNKTKDKSDFLKSSGQLLTFKNKSQSIFDQKQKINITSKDQPQVDKNLHENTLKKIQSLNKDIALKKCMNTQSFPLFIPENKYIRSNKTVYQNQSMKNEEERRANEVMGKFESSFPIPNQKSNCIPDENTKNQNYTVRPVIQKQGQRNSKYLHGSMYRSNNNLQSLNFTNPEYTRHTYYHPEEIKQIGQKINADFSPTNKSVHFYQKK